MNRALVLVPLVCTSVVVACAREAPKPPPPPKPTPLNPVAAVADEVHLGDVRQVTLGGENAEAYWAWGGRELILQARAGDQDCDRIYRMPLSTVIGVPDERASL